MERLERQPSVANRLRERDREEFLKLSLEERLQRSWEGAEIDLEVFRQAQEVDRRTAIRLLQRRRQAGRTPSKCMSEIIG